MEDVLEKPAPSADPPVHELLSVSMADEEVPSIEPVVPELQFESFSSDSKVDAPGEPQNEGSSLMQEHRHGEPNDFSDASRFSVEFYRQYFDVDTDQVQSRIMKALKPMSSSFIDEVGPNPDLYGPFWISATLVFVTAAAGNLASYISHDQEVRKRGLRCRQ
eukprot:TRINITY_DN1163_c0_g1_i2.p1 TRINITY_DN1163_c0_g1~~TRINITY_DN1163_c0_g1_i2.p1  ORF type:complete len:162 (-),score=30.98 TRINITY_DN1163_c0_g1_i2:899-1384(-)